jgi:hypothetical protein
MKRSIVESNGSLLGSSPTIAKRTMTIK